MELKKDYLKQKLREYEQLAEKHKSDFYFFSGKAEAVGQLIGDLQLQIVEEKDIKKVEPA